jgi:hypothetical protein
LFSLVSSVASVSTRAFGGFLRRVPPVVRLILCDAWRADVTAERRVVLGCRLSVAVCRCHVGHVVAARMLSACALCVPIACSGTCLATSAKRPPRELTLSVQARKSRASLPPRCLASNSRPRRRSLFFGGKPAWPAEGLYRSARRSEVLGTALSVNRFRRALRNNMSAARAVKHGKRDVSDRELFPKQSGSSPET